MAKYANILRKCGQRLEIQLKCNDAKNVRGRLNIVPVVFSGRETTEYAERQLRRYRRNKFARDQTIKLAKGVPGARHRSEINHL